MIRAVLFDFWDTLVYQPKDEARKLEAIRFRCLIEGLVKAGFSITLEKLEEAVEEILKLRGERAG